MNRLFFVRPAMKVADCARRLLWRLRGKTIYGVMALAYTPAGKLLLIRQTYMDGWCLPGGGRRREEDPVVAALRELQQEIGLIDWSDAIRLGTVQRQLSGVPANIDLVRVGGVVFQFRKNWETEEVREFSRTELPADINSWSLNFIQVEKSFE